MKIAINGFGRIGRSVFRIRDFEALRPTTMALLPATPERRSLGSRLKGLVRSLVPSKSLSSTDFSARDALAEIARRIPAPKVLVVGAGDAQLDASQVGTIVYTDVAHGALTDIVADGHDLPFQDNRSEERR